MSTNKTKNYGLHAWEPGDDFLRSEFNENFEKLDEAVRGLVVVGSYQGDGAERREIALGFRPRAVLVFDEYGMTYVPATYTYNGGLAIDGAPAGYNDQYPSVLITDNGFQVAYQYVSPYSLNTNRKDMGYRYLALR